jgi:hypothetical protein
VLHGKAEFLRQTSMGDQDHADHLRSEVSQPAFRTGYSASASPLSLG